MAGSGGLAGVNVPDDCADGTKRRKGGAMQEFARHRSFATIAPWILIQTHLQGLRAS
jgi:hypothetical protein